MLKSKESHRDELHQALGRYSDPSALVIQAQVVVYALEAGARTHRSDADIDAAVRRALRSLGPGAVRGLSAEVRDGTILLTGAADGEQQRMTIIDRLSSLDGVREVLSGIALSSRSAGT